MPAESTTQYEEGEGFDSTEWTSTETDEAVDTANGDVTQTKEGMEPEVKTGTMVNLLPFSLLFGFGAVFTNAQLYTTIAQITMIEKVFHLPSRKSGLLMSAQEIGYISMILFSSHFLQRFHKPRILAVATFLCGLVGSLSCLPHFIAKTSLQEDMKPQSNASRSSSLASLCIPREQNGTWHNNSCHANADGDASVTQDNDMLAFAIIFVCTLIPGMCLSTRIPLVTTYVDNNSEKTKSGFYLGILNSFAVFGAVLAIGLGGLFNKVPIDLKNTDLTPEDPRWLGAWWLSFPVFGAGSILLSIPLAFFPRGHEPLSDKVHAEGKVEPPLLHQITDMPKSLLRILSSPVFSLSVLSWVFFIFGGMALAAFGPKYPETQFNIPTWKANTIIAFSNLVTTVVGTFTGGVLARRLRLELPGLLTLCCVVELVNIGLSTFLYWFGCQNQNIIGLDSNSGAFAPGFNTTCDCTGTPFLPVCVEGTSTYYSPCHAGCQVQTPSGYSNCTMSATGDVIPGLCDTGCPFLIPWIGQTVVVALVSCMIYAPFYLVIIRSVGEKDKSLAMGLYACLQSLLVFLPAPIMYGKLIDNTCRIWNTVCGVQGACALYDIVSMRITLVSVQLGMTVVSVILMGAALLYARKTYVPASEKTFSVNVPGNPEKTDNTTK